MVETYLELRLGCLLGYLPGVVAADTLGLLQLPLRQLPDTRQPFPDTTNITERDSD